MPASHAGAWPLVVVPLASAGWYLAAHFVCECDNSPLCTRVCLFDPPAEVAFSKFLPGGFMWQAGAVATVYANYTTDSFVQFGLTGLGDALGVFIGHVSLYAFRRHVLRGRNDVMQAVEVGFVLAAASFVSGSIWQPALNLARDQFLFGFWLCAVVVGVICAIGFFIGLRLARWALPRVRAVVSLLLCRRTPLTMRVGATAVVWVAQVSGATPSLTHCRCHACHGRVRFLGVVRVDRQLLQGRSLLVLPQHRG